MFRLTFLDTRFTRKASLVNWSLAKFGNLYVRVSSIKAIQFLSRTSSNETSTKSAIALDKQSDLSPTDISNSRVDFSSDGSSRTRRVITTRQHFQAASPPPLSIFTNTRFFHSFSPTDFSSSRIDLSSDCSSWTRWVVPTRQLFQAAWPPPLSSKNIFLLLPVYFRKHRDPTSAWRVVLTKKST